MDALAVLVHELSPQFPTVEPADLRRHCERAVQDLGGAVPPPALPELLSRLVRLRLIAELLGDDLDVAALLCSANSLTALAGALRAVISYRLGSVGASLVLVDGDECFYADEDPTASVWAGQRLPVTDCLSGWTIRHNQVALIHDVELDERVPARVYRSAEVRSMLVAPIPGRTGPAGAISAYWPVPRQAARADRGWLLRLAQASSGVLAEIGLDEAPWAPHFGTRYGPGRR